MYELAEILHKTVAEVEGMSVSEFNGWVAHFEAKRKRA